MVPSFAKHSILPLLSSAASPSFPGPSFPKKEYRAQLLNSLDLSLELHPPFGMKLTITTIFLVLCLLGSKVAADYKVLENATSIIPRDNIFDKRCSGTCAECFGAGNVQCVGLTCYNPSAGEVCTASFSRLDHHRLILCFPLQSCCSNGDYCPAGKVCANIEGNCCNAVSPYYFSCLLTSPVYCSSATSFALECF